MSFRTVTVEQAKASRYYGFDGWLMVFYVYAAWTAFSATAFALSVFRVELFDLTAMQSMMAVRAISLLPFLILTPMKHRFMPVAAIICEWVHTAISSFFTPSLWTSMFDAMKQVVEITASQRVPAPELGPTMTHFDDVAEVFVQVAIWNSILIGVAMTVLFTWYLLASKRVNATYRHRLRSDVP